ncbi:hypothetical protein ACK8P5_26275 (plasmid) [Paenibacillus sp. EC2-1]|uniref:hypothetical protein n=1 Tax=Paenibacillus sp. EC2-1 TaxID=3388665 RepID=UPI003BEEB94F
MSNQVKLVDLELQLLKLWSDSGIEEVYKYKNRIKKAAREGLASYDLFCDMTCGEMFTDVEDTANGDDLYAEDCKVSVESLIQSRKVLTIKPAEAYACPKCGNKNCFNKPLDETQVDWLKCSFCDSRHPTEEWKGISTIKPGDKVNYTGFHDEKEMWEWLRSNQCARCGIVTIPDDEIWCDKCRPKSEVMK